MKLALFNTLYPTPSHPKIVGGAERSVRILAEALSRAGHSVLVIRALPPRAHPSVEVVEGVQVAGIPIKNSYWPFDRSEQHNVLQRLAWHARDDRAAEHTLVAEQLDTFEPDVIHTNNLSGLSTSVWRMAQRRGVPIVHTLRDYYLVCPRTKRFRGGRRCARPCVDCTLVTRQRRSETALVDAVVGISRATLDLHLQAGLFSNARWSGVIHNPVHQTGAVGPNPKSGVTFGFIGRVTVEKGVDQLARAYRRLPNTARLVVAGETDLATQHRLQALAGDRLITFLGFVAPEVFYAQVDVVVVPSLWDEPLSRAVQEAHAFARPVIGSARGGIPEALGKGGWLFDPDQVDGLVQVMTELTEEPHAIAEKAAIAAAGVSRFDPARIAVEYCRVYERVAELRRERSTT